MNRPMPGRKITRDRPKLKNPKITLGRLLKYLGKGKIVLITVFTLCIITTLISIYGTIKQRDIIDDYVLKGNLSGLKILLIVLAGLYLLSVISQFIQSRMMITLSQKTCFVIRKDLFNSLETLPLKFFDSHKSGDIMSRLTNDVDNINMALSQSVSQFFSGIITIIGMIIAMFIVSWPLAIISIVLTPINVLCAKKMIKLSQPYYIKQQQNIGAVNSYVEEMVSGQKTIFLFEQENKVKDDFKEINRRVTKSTIFSQALSGFMGPINNFFNNFSYLVIAIIGAVFLLNNIAGVTLGAISSFVIFQRMFHRPVNEILNLFASIQLALAGAERVFELMDENKELDDSTDIELDSIKGNVEFKNVYFGYDADELILKDINLKSKKGQTIALVGHTGAGKTTIVNLLTRFYDINKGEITIDGHNIKDIKRESVRKNISIVLQDTYLFTKSIKENIKYGNTLAKDEEIIEAAKIANAHHFIMQLPEGYDTVLADNGSNLSQGQRQLLAIARAVLSKSEILILDEATSNVDTKTEREIQEAMLNLMKGKTSFVIAHRLSTIKNADQIILLDDGEIVERGNHEELLNKKGMYFNLYNSQFQE